MALKKKETKEDIVKPAAKVAVKPVAMAKPELVVDSVKEVVMEALPKGYVEVMPSFGNFMCDLSSGTRIPPGQFTLLKKTSWIACQIDAKILTVK